MKLSGVKVDLDEILRLPLASPLKSLELGGCPQIDSKWKAKAVKAGLLAE